MINFEVPRHVLKAVEKFCAIDDARYYLKGIEIESNEKETRLMATDGHAMIVYRVDGFERNGSFKGIIPSDAIDTILRWKGCKTTNGFPVRFSTAEPFEIANEIRADWFDNSILFKLIDGNAPDYRRVVPKSVTGEPALFDPALLMRCKIAHGILTDSTKTPILCQNGNSAAIVLSVPEVVMVVMPMSTKFLTTDITQCAWANE